MQMILFANELNFHGGLFSHLYAVLLPCQFGYTQLSCQFSYTHVS